MNTQRLTRRHTLLSLGGLLGLAAGWKAESAASGVGPAAVASGAVSCVLTPEMTEGPFYIPNEKLRRDITEGKPGTPLLLKLAVVDASTCRALPTAVVDIWHCDAGGVYSGFSSLGASQTNRLTFLRGLQKTNSHGIATFQTLYPGWYQGRTVHIHVKVHLGGRVAHTGQLFFDDSLTDAVYKRLPYSRRPNRDVRNAQDAIFRNGGSKSLLNVHRSGNGYVGSITMGVQTG
jgi:protocatechuate 3,4-dioxygenase beta subunit